MFGEVETTYAENKLKIDEYAIQSNEEMEKQDVERRTESNKFLEQLLGGMGGQQQGQQQQQPKQQTQPQVE